MELHLNYLCNPKMSEAMRGTYRVLFYLKKNKPQASGKVPVMGRITVNGTIAQFSCKLNINPALWDLKSNRAAGKSIEARKINEMLDNIRLQLNKHYQTICDKDAYVTADKVRDAYFGFGEGCKPCYLFSKITTTVSVGTSGKTGCKALSAKKQDVKPCDLYNSKLQGFLFSRVTIWQSCDFHRPASVFA